MAGEAVTKDDGKVRRPNPKTRHASSLGAVGRQLPTGTWVNHKWVQDAPVAALPPFPIPVPESAPRPAVQAPREPMPTLHDVTRGGFEDQPLWVVSIEATIEVRAERIEDAITQARVKYPHARIRGINLA